MFEVRVYNNSDSIWKYVIFLREGPEFFTLFESRFLYFSQPEARRQGRRFLATKLKQYVFQS